MTVTVRRHLQAIFEKRDSPGDENHGDQRRRLVFQMAVPRESHEHVRRGEHQNREQRQQGNGNGRHAVNPCGKSLSGEYNRGTNGPKSQDAEFAELSGLCMHGFRGMGAGGLNSLLVVRRGVGDGGREGAAKAAEV